MTTSIAPSNKIHNIEHISLCSFLKGFVPNLQLFFLEMHLLMINRKSLISNAHCYWSDTFNTGIEEELNGTVSKVDQGDKHDYKSTRSTSQSVQCLDQRFHGMCGLGICEFKSGDGKKNFGGCNDRNLRNLPKDPDFVLGYHLKYMFFRLKWEENYL